MIRIPAETRASNKLKVSTQVERLCHATHVDSGLELPQWHVCPIAILGDANRHGIVHFADITSVLENWGIVHASPVGPGDADFSRGVHFADITAVLRAFGDSCR